MAHVGKGNAKAQVGRPTMRDGGGPKKQASIVGLVMLQGCAKAVGAVTSNTSSCFWLEYDERRHAKMK